MEDNKLRKIYSLLGLTDNDGKFLTLHSDCPNSEYCWKYAKERKPKDDGFWTVTRPWIGARYSELRLLAIGINMNQYGSYEGAINLINQTKIEIKQGKRKMFVTNEYSGTFFFHRMGSYITAFVENALLITPTWKNNYPLPEDIVSSFDFISYTNHIKCSPKNDKSKPSDKSKPTYQMWEKCGNFILKQEIELLKPSKILILGNADNFRFFNQNVLDNKIHLERKGKVEIGNGYVNKKPIEIFVVPHPASFGGNSYKIMNDLNCVINNRC